MSGAHDGLMPHTLAFDIEEAPSTFHVPITRRDTALHAACITWVVVSVGYVIPQLVWPNLIRSLLKKG